jgi:hypothetical protein
VEKKNRLNFFVGLILTGIVTLPTLTIVLGDIRRPSFSPENAWAWLALWCFLAFGFVVSIVGLMRKVHWGHMVWAQTILSFLVLTVYIGWYRRELDYVQMGPDPGAIDQGPPVAAWPGFLLFVFMWLVAGFLPMALSRLRRRGKPQDSVSGQVGASQPDGTYTPAFPTAPVSDPPSQSPVPELPSIPKSPLPLWLARGLKLYGLAAYILVAWMLDLPFSVIETIVESGAGYALAGWWIRKMDSRPTRVHSTVIVTGFLLLHACMACIIDLRLATWLIWSYLKLKQMVPKGPSGTFSVTSQLIARLADLAIMIISGIVALLMGLRVIGPKPRQSESYDIHYGKWIRHFRWMGPLIIAASIFGFVVKTFVLGI